MNAPDMSKPRIIRPQEIGGDTFHVAKENLSGAFIFTVNGQSIRMSPRQAHDLAIKILAHQGFALEEVEKAGAHLAGPRLS